MIPRYKRLVPLPLSGRRASANLVPIPPPASNLFGSSFALRRVPQLEYRGEGKALFGYFLGPVNRSFTCKYYPQSRDLYNARGSMLGSFGKIFMSAKLHATSKLVQVDTSGCSLG